MMSLRLIAPLTVGLALTACGGVDEKQDETLSCIPDYSAVSANPKGAKDACESTWEAVCTRLVDDCSYLVDDAYTNVDNCVDAYATNGCAGLTSYRPSATMADLCAAQVASVECGYLADIGLPRSCELSMSPVPPESDSCPEIDFGTVTGTVAPTTQWGPVATFCMCLDAGQPFEAYVDPAEGGNYALLVFGPDGTWIAFDAPSSDGDYAPSIDRAVAFESGGHMFLVVGDEGNVALTVNNLTPQ